MSKTTFPIQPMKDQRFIENRIVTKLLDDGPFDMNSIAMWDVTNEEREQFAMLIGYSYSGFGELSYVSDETYEAIDLMYEKEISECEARLEVLRNNMDGIRKGLKLAIPNAFKIHPDDLEV